MHFDEAATTFAVLVLEVDTTCFAESRVAARTRSRAALLVSKRLRRKFSLPKLN